MQVFYFNQKDIPADNTVADDYFHANTVHMLNDVIMVGIPSYIPKSKV